MRAVSNPLQFPNPSNAETIQIPDDSSQSLNFQESLIQTILVSCFFPRLNQIGSWIIHSYTTTPTPRIVYRIAHTNRNSPEPSIVSPIDRAMTDSCVYPNLAGMLDAALLLPEPTLSVKPALAA